MHNSPLKRLRNFSQLTLAMIALGFSPVLHAVCPGAFYPSASSDELLMPPGATQRLLSQVSASRDCPQLNADLAELYFWGNTDQPTVPKKAAQYLQKLRAIDPGHAVLRRLEPAMVVLGLEDRFSIDEALRRIARELDSGDALRRDKMLATVNQLSKWLPEMTVADRPLYADAQRTSEVAPDGQGLARGLVLNAGRGELLVADASGRPRRVWTKGIDMDVVNAGHPVVTAAPMFQVSALDADGDRRTQVWRFADAAPSSGRLTIRFQRPDGPHQIHCTATPLSPHWLLTAAHCLFPPTEVEGDILSGASYRDADGNLWPVAEFWLHRDHREADQGAGAIERYSGSDIALLKLRQPLQHFRPPSLMTLSSKQRQLVIDSYGYPSDKVKNSLWYSRCGARRYSEGRKNLAPLYRLNCFSASGQSGAVILLADRPGAAVGVLSARLSGDGLDGPVFSVLTAPLIRDIQHLLSGRSGGLEILRPFKRLSSQLALGDG